MNNERTITIARRIAQAVERLEILQMSQEVFARAGSAIPKRSKRRMAFTKTRIELLCHALTNA
jgi:hypothetical protein